MTDKYNLDNVYINEFESNGVLAVSVQKYLSFGIFLFQLSMCRLFTAIINDDVIIASGIVIFGEIFFMIVFGKFKVPQLKDILQESRHTSLNCSSGSRLSQS